MIDGVVNVVDNYAKILSKKHNVTVFVPASRDKNFKDDFPYKVVRCKNFPIGIGDYNMATPRLDKNFKKAIKENGPYDIIHIHSPFTVAKAGIRYAKKHDIPTVIHLHSQFKQDFMEKTHSHLLTAILMAYMRKSFNSCDELWTMNPKLVDLAREYGCKGKITIHPNGCDMTPDVNLEAAKKLRKKYAQDDEKVLLFVGRIHKLKNIRFSIDVCEKLKELGFKFKMLFAGDGQDFEHFKKYTTSKNLDDKVLFLGKIKDRKKLKLLYKLADLFVFPSNYDSDGLVKNEAAAMQTPTIFIDGSITASSVKDDFNGYLCEEDVDKFAQKIVDIFKDEKDYQKVCENAQKTLYFSWNDIVNKAEKEYLRVIEEHKKKGEKK